MDLKEKIQFARKKKSMTQLDLASMLNVDPQVVVEWEEGKSKPDVNHLEYISKMCDIPLRYLMGNSNDNENKEFFW